MTQKITQEYVLKVVAEGLGQVTGQLKQLSSDLQALPGQMGKVTGSFKGSKKAIDDNSTSLKGIAGATNNSTKAFAKMKEGLVGSLVPAYATVAANVFALTAAFNALERAADLKILIDSAEVLANKTGRSLTALAKDMKEITGGALSMKEAMVSASLAASAGFDDTTIKNLTKAAKNASVALGREMTDSINRVFKGAIKAEPELLDELGIILRLEPATKKYAASIGKAVKDLTTFEKQQAIVNEVIQQANDKFGALSEVNANPYTRMAAALADLSNSFLTLLNKPISGFFNLLADNTELLVIGIALLARNIISLATPALEKMGNTFAAFSNKIENAASELEAFTQLRATGQDPRILNNGIQALEHYKDAISAVSSKQKLANKLGDDAVDINKKVTATLVSAKATLKSLKEGKLIEGLNLGSSLSSAEQIGALEGIILQLKNYQAETKKTATITNKFLQSGSEKLADFAEGFNFLVKTAKSSFNSVAQATGPIDALRLSFIQLKLAALEATGGMTLFGKATILVGKITGAAIGSLAGLAVSFLKFLPYLGIATLAWDAFVGAIHKLGFSDLSAPMDAQAESLKTTSVALDNYIKNILTLSDTLDNTTKKLEFQANTLNSIASGLKTASDEIKKGGGFDFVDVVFGTFNFGSFETFRENLQTIQDDLRKLGLEKEVAKTIKDFGNALYLSREDAIKLSDALIKLSDEQNRFAQGAKEGIKTFGEAFDSLDKNLLGLSGSLPKLNEVQKVLVDLTNILNQSNGKTGGQLITGLTKLGDAKLDQLNLKLLVQTASDAAIKIEDLTKQQNELLVKQKELGSLWFHDHEQFNKNREELKRINDELAKGIKTQEAFGIAIRINLEENVKRFQALADAKDQLERTKLNIDVQGLASKNDLEDRLSLIKQLAVAEVTALKTIADQDYKLSKSLSEEVSKLEEQKTNLIYTKDNKIRLDINTAEIQNKLFVLDRALAVKREAKIQVDSRQFKTANDEVNILKASVSKLISELSNTTKYSDISFFADQADKIKANLIPAIEELKKHLDEAGKASLDKLIPNEQEISKRLSAFNSAGLSSTGTQLGDVTKAADANKAADDRLSMLSRELDLNTELDNTLDQRLDKQYLLNQAQLQSQLMVATQLNDGPLQITTGLLLIKNEEERLKFIDLQYKAMEKAIALETKNQSAVSKYEKQRIAREQKLLAFNKGSKEYEELKKQLEELDKLSNKLDLGKTISAAADSMNDLAAATRNMTEAMVGGNELEIKVAGLQALQAIGDDLGGTFGNIAKGFATISASIVDYNMQQERIKENLADGTITKQTAELMDQQSQYQAIGNSLGALAGMMKENSSAAKLLTLAQQGLAIANAAAAVANAGTSGDPYTAPARVAAMLALMASVLGAANIAFGGGTGAGSGAEQAQKLYDKQTGTDNIRGVTLANEGALRKSINDLIDIDTKLFSTNRELQLEIKGLAEVFKKVAQEVFNAVDGLSSDFINVTFSPINSSDNVSFNEALSYLEDGIMNITASLFKLNAKDFISGIGSIGDSILSAFGLGSERSITETILGAGIEFAAQIQGAGDSLTGSVKDAITFANVFREDRTSHAFHSDTVTQTTFTRTGAISQSAQAALQQGLDYTVEIVSGLISDFANSFGIDMTAIVDGVVIDIKDMQAVLQQGGKDLNPDEYIKVLSDYFSAIGDKTVSTLLPFIKEISNIGESSLDALVRLTSESSGLNNLLSTIGTDLTQILSTGIDLSAVSREVALENARLSAIWIDSLYKQFLDNPELVDIFNKFSKSIYSETELLNFALDNANAVVDDGFGRIREILNTLDNTSLLGILDTQGNTREALRAIFDLGSATGAFVGDQGLALFDTIIKTGSALTDLTDIVDQFNNKILDFEKGLLRQIAAFGLAGKQLDLLQLDFNYQDTLDEARKIGADITIVEKLFGLQRLEIIKNYNQEIVNSIKDISSKIFDTTLSIRKSSDGWDEVIYQSLKIDAMAKRLGKSLPGIDLSVFDISGDISSIEEFKANFSDILMFITNSPTSIKDQISLVNDLESAITDRYNLELSNIEALQNKLLNFSTSIKDFLEGLLVGDLSPLTNFQRLTEAQNQFNENLVNSVSSDTAVAERAQNNLLDSANTLLDQASLFYSIGPEFQSIFNNVYSQLATLNEDILTQLNMTQAEIQSQALLDLRTTTLEQLSTLNSVLSVLEAQNTSSLELELQNLGTDITTHLGFILDKLTSINDSSWAPLVDILSNLSSYDVGSSNIAYDQLAMVHKGEAILTASSAESVRSGNSIISNGYNGSSSDNSDVIVAIRQLTEVLANSQSDLVDIGNKSIEVSRDIVKNISTNKQANIKGVL